MNKGGPGARKSKPGPRGERILILPLLFELFYLALHSVGNYFYRDEGSI